ncbi:SlyX family protein [Hyphomonas sp.]|uniref:SlyX family protein n=2 Tax=Pseudomonadota TaxID=1224 RepID=UPI003262FC37
MTRPTASPLSRLTPTANPPAMSDTSNTSTRLDELEMRVVHQDQTIEDLNAAITAQWKLIERLEARVARLAERVADSEQSTGQAAPVDRPPPHY